MLRTSLRLRRSKIGIVYSELGVKAWRVGPPDVELVRPTRCPCCGRVSRPAGDGLGMHGHGVRARQQWGPPAPRAAPAMPTLVLRRYQCQHDDCGAVVLVGPRVVRWRYLYSGAAIAFALAAWALEHRPAREVRAAVSVFTIVGPTARGWASLGRWARRSHELWSSVRPWPDERPPRQIAERAARTVASAAPVATGVIALDAFAGAEHAR